MKASTLSLAVLAVFGLAATAQADVQSGIIGDTATIQVGETTETIPGGPHPSFPGLPGIGHIDLAGGTLVSFDSLQNIEGITSGTGEPGNWKRTHITPNETGNDHGDIGYFNFVQVANESVYFGEWSQEGTSSDSTHTVYYAGEAGDVVNTLPTQTATYTVVGINNGGLLNGTLTANFGGNNLLEGALFHSSLTLDIQAQIDSSDASFAGAAFANTGDGSIALGDSSGHFFGNGASALAGLASFEDVSLNTAFGGIKD